MYLFHAHIYTHIYMHTIHAYTHTYIQYIYMVTYPTYRHWHTFRYTHSCTLTFKHTHVHTHTYKSHTYIHTYIQITYTYMYIHSYIHIYTYTHFVCIYTFYSLCVLNNDDEIQWWIKFCVNKMLHTYWILGWHLHESLHHLQCKRYKILGMISFMTRQIIHVMADKNMQVRNFYGWIWL